MAKFSYKAINFLIFLFTISGIILLCNTLSLASTIIYSYDGLNRLESASGPFGNITYEYDNIGNFQSAERILNQYTITANAIGNGSGSVTSNVGGINFQYQAVSGATSSDINYGTAVTLTATANTGSTVAWNDCGVAGGIPSGNGTATAQCTISSLEAGKTLTATFSLDQYTITVNATGNGSGFVTSDVGGINFQYQSIAEAFSSPINYGTSVTTTAIADE